MADLLAIEPLFGNVQKEAPLPPACSCDLSGCEVLVGGPHGAFGPFGAKYGDTSICLWSIWSI